MTAAADREFRILPRGDIRDRVILANFRAGLRQLTNPETGLPFTEEEIARATQPKTRFFIEADAIDSFGQGEQRRAIYLADQVRIDRASTSWLEGYHAPLWGKEKLPATGGGGTVTVRGTTGTQVLGSTTVPDPSAYSARSTAGKVFQVIGTATLVGGTAIVTMVCRDTGSDTNPAKGDVLTWITRDPGMEVQCVVAEDFKGGTDIETDAEQAKRIQSAIRYKEGAGNDAQFRAWARAASNAIEDAFIYPCALNAGSVVVAVSQKRGVSAGPSARLPSVSLQATVIQQLTPPGSPVVPTPPSVLVVPIASQTADIQLKITLRKGSAEGWIDLLPFPAYHATAPHVESVTDATHFVLHAPGDATLPGQSAGATLTSPNVPKMAVWRAATSRFEPLPVQSIQDSGGSLFAVTLFVASALAPGDWISPQCGQATAVTASVTSYMDARGPGEIVDGSDPRAVRCQRFPAVSEEWPVGIGGDLGVRVISDLGGSSSDAQLMSGGVAAPDVPGVLTAGPNMLTLNRLGLYSA